MFETIKKAVMSKAGKVIGAGLIAAAVTLGITAFMGNDEGEVEQPVEAEVVEVVEAEVIDQ